MTRILLVFFFCLAPTFAFAAHAAERIISLAPHTTEWLFELGVGERVVAVSAYSDYPAAAAQLPVVADANGIDIEQIIRLSPDLILAWKGGNKPQDLARLESLGFDLFYSSPEAPADIVMEMQVVGERLGVSKQVNRISEAFSNQLKRIKSQYIGYDKQSVFYYMWLSPLMSIGPNAWATKLLEHCNAEHVFMDASVDYPQVSAEQVIRRQPSLLVAASKLPMQQHRAYWQRWDTLLSAPVLVVDPDLLHRFTPRMLRGLEQLCEGIHQYSADISNGSADK